MLERLEARYLKRVLKRWYFHRLGLLFGAGIYTVLSGKARDESAAIQRIILSVDAELSSITPTGYKRPVR